MKEKGHISLLFGNSNNAFSHTFCLHVSMRGQFFNMSMILLPFINHNSNSED